MRQLQFFPYLIALVEATASWVNPPALTSSGIGQFADNLVWEVGSSQVLVYDTNFTAISLCLYQNNNSTFQYIAQNHATDQSSTQQTYKWTVGELLDGSSGNITFDGNFYTEFFPNTGDPFLIYIFEEGATSGTGSSYVNITAAKEVVASTTSSATSTKTTTSASSGSTSASKTTSSATTPATETASSSTATSTVAASSGISSGAKAGIGIGVTLAVLAVLGGIALFFYRRGKKQSTGQRPLHQIPAEVHGASAGVGPYEVNGFEMADGMGGELVRGTYRYHLARSDVTSPGYSDNSTSAGSGSQELDAHSQQGRI